MQFTHSKPIVEAIPAKMLRETIDKFKINSTAMIYITIEIYVSLYPCNFSCKAKRATNINFAFICMRTK